MATPAARSAGTPACSMKATGGLTHFIDGLLPAGPSQARCANFEPAGRASQKAANISTMAARDRLA